MGTCYWCDEPAVAAFLFCGSPHTGCERHARVHGRGTRQPDLFSPMCAENVAVQAVLLPEDEPRKADGPRLPDLPGQTLFA